MAIEGILAFFMEATFIAAMFFGWEKVSKRFHLLSTWLTIVGATLSALWILIANAWMQFPDGMQFNPDTVRNEVSSWYLLKNAKRDADAYVPGIANLIEGGYTTDDDTPALSATEKIERGKTAIQALATYRQAVGYKDEVTAQQARKQLDKMEKKRDTTY